MNRKQRRAAEAASPPGGGLDALYALAMAHQRAGRLAAALDCFRTAAARAPRSAQAQYNLGVACTQAGARAEALAAFAAAARLQPDFAEALTNLGTALLEAGRLDEAEAALTKAVRLGPGATGHNSLGAVLKRQGRLAEAAAAFEAALAIAPAHVDALTNLAGVLADLGAAAPAMARIRQALALAPAHAKARNILGVILLDQGERAAAADAFRAAIAQAPAEPDAYVNLGDTLAGLGEPGQEVALCREAVARAPDSVAALNNLGTALYNARALPEAIATFRRAVALAPEAAEGHFHLGMARLAAGDMPGGWHDYEWRWRTPFLGPLRRHFAAPLWDGASPGTLLLHAEQGFGDTIQFCRYAPLLAARGWRVHLEVQPPLHRLLRGLPGLASVIARGEALPEVDAQAPLMSLPSLLGTSLASIPGATPYLAAAPADSARVAAGLPPRPGRRVGLAWAGNAYRSSRELAAVNRRRSLDPAALAPLAALPGVHLISLQKDGAAPGLPLTDLMPAVQDFADTAALIDNLDLVIAVDTAVAHLAGALGKPVWLLNRYDAEWRWLHGRRDSPWYPTMRIFPQQAAGDWAPVVADVATALAALGPGAQ
jgi:tetratricopeptide (TPR) repeat protein